MNHDAKDQQPADQLRERRHGLLFFGAGPTGWSITDPDSEELRATMERLRDAVRMPAGLDGGYDDRTHGGQLRADLHRVMRVVDDYQHLTSYELGVEHILKKLRVIWRALRSPQ